MSDVDKLTAQLKALNAECEKIEKDITALLDRCNVAGRASLVVPAEYLEVVIERK